MSTIIVAEGSATGRSEPIAAASGSSISATADAPAADEASTSARRSTSVMPDGAHSTRRGCPKRERWTRPRKYRSICSVTSKSAMTPWRSGRTAEMVAGVRPIICLASSPTA